MGLDSGLDALTKARKDETAKEEEEEEEDWQRRHDRRASPGVVLFFALSYFRDFVILLRLVALHPSRWGPERFSAARRIFCLPGW
jgi:hypothetical protein